MKKMCVLLMALAMPVPVLAQEVAATPVATPASISVGMRVGELPSGYDDGGRRDPFVSLVAPKRTSGPGGTTRPRHGLPGMSLADVVVRGIIRNGNNMFAILETPGKQSYVAKLNDKLADASVQSIDTEGVVFVEIDGMGKPGAQVRKTLRSAQDPAEGEEDR